MALGETVQNLGSSLTGGPIIAPDDLEILAREEELRHDLERQIDHAIAEINGNPAIDPETRDKLISNLRSLRNGIGLNPNLAQIQKEINDARAVGYQASSTSAIFSSLSLAGQREVSLRVAEQFDAILDGDIADIAKRFRGAAYDELPAEIQKSVDAATEAHLASPHGQTLIKAAQKAQQENPEAFKEALREINTREKFLKERLEAETDPARRAMIEKMLQSGAYNMPASAAFSDGLLKNAPIESLREAFNQANFELRTSIVGAVPTMRKVNALQLEEIISQAPEELRETIKNNDAALAKYLQEACDGITPEERKKALGKIGRNSEELTAREKEIIAISTVMPTLNSTLAITGTLMRLGRAQDLEKKLESGLSLSDEDQLRVDNLRTIRDTSRSLTERAKLLAETTLEGAIEGHSSIIKASANSKASNLALATLTLAYTDQNGGVNKFQEYAQRVEFTKSSGARDLEAEAYFSKYQDFLSRSLINQPYNPNDPRQKSELATALNEAGRKLETGQLQAFSSSSGLLFLDTTTTSYTMKSSVFEYSGQAFNAAYGGPAENVKSLYEESRTIRANDPEFVSIVRDIDTYRLQNDPNSEALIRDVWLGKVPLTEIRAKLDEKIVEEREGMQEFAGYARNIAKGEDVKIQENLLIKYNLKNADGSVNVEALMNKIQDNKVIVYDYWQEYKNFSTEDLRSGKIQPKDPSHNLQHLAEARTLAELGTLMRSAHSIEHLTSRIKALDDEIDLIQDNGGTPAAHLLNDQKLLIKVMQYDINNPEQGRAEFRAALTEFLMRDAYVAEKEAADASKPDGEKSNLVANTISVIEARLRDEPEYFRAIHDQHAEHGQPQQAPAPTNTLPSNTDTPASPGLSAAEVAALTSEGSKDGWDSAFQNAIEDRIKRALTGKTMSEIVAIFRDNVTGVDLLGASNVGNLNNISVNEIENALRLVADAKAGKHLTSKQVVDLLDTADANGKKDGLLSIDEIVAGLKQNGELASGLNSAVATVAGATSAAPSTVPPAAATPAAAAGR